MPRLHRQVLALVHRCLRPKAQRTYQVVSACLTPDSKQDPEDVLCYTNVNFFIHLSMQPVQVIHQLLRQWFRHLCQVWPPRWLLAVNPRWFLLLRQVEFQGAFYCVKFESRKDKNNPLTLYFDFSQLRAFQCTLISTINDTFFEQRYVTICVAVGSRYGSGCRRRGDQSQV